MVTHFTSLQEYGRFVFARAFWDTRENRPFAYAPNRTEQLGRWLVRPILGSADFAFRNIRNPLFITSLVVIGIAAATIGFYPSQFMAVVGIALSPARVKLALYMTIQTTIIGLFLRTWGRLDPTGPVMRAWTEDGPRRLQPIPIGMVIH